MADPGDAVLLGGAPGTLLAGHLAVAAGPAHVAVLRTGGLPLFGGGAASPAGWWHSAALDTGEPRYDAAGCATAAGVHHGVNRQGLFVACAAAGPAARAGLAGALLGHAGGVEEAASLLATAAAALELDGPDQVLLADPGSALRIEVDADGARRHPLPMPGTAGAGLDTLRAALRRRAAAGTVSVVAACLEAGRPELLVCLGPPTAGVFVRQWPGLPAPPPLTCAADRPPLLGSLAGALAASSLVPDAAGPLTAAEAAALAEGEDAERMARIMDAAGDDHGAEVRRALAQSHAAGLAAAALERLLAAGEHDQWPTL